MQAGHSKLGKIFLDSLYQVSGSIGAEDGLVAQDEGHVEMSSFQEFGECGNSGIGDFDTELGLGHGDQSSCFVGVNAVVSDLGACGAIEVKLLQGECACLVHEF